ncbi:ABC-2 type transport system ATP-binding protein [Natronospira proteinivora]|uniref:ABC-2 type transport system ATP-binding protein n=1 Tax=Natronospira proteinivora TaxID=1807133 RepID=A0ABT1GBV7_9GAMM|nr:ATP-binding cassette domain-containing protein [Natronospira proteinivora]MCP1728547.1 ABC-2 type transport system ATP-binding protein [Natronospira proteinivora]
MDEGQNNLVMCRELGRDYGGQTAVSSLSFSLARGEVLGFLGPNGAGKSTTMNMLSGCLAPSRGEVEICGIDLLASPAQAKAHIGYMPEHPPLYPELTVDEYLRFAARLRGLPRRRVKAAVETARERCGLADVGHRPIGQLSRGYQQRVGIAQAIVHEPALVILDEPTVGLDPNQVREIRALIQTLARDHGVILSTHILPEVAAVCSRVQIMVRGQLVFESPMAELGDAGEGGGRLKLHLSEQAEADPLAGLSGVSRVETLGPGQFRLHHAGNKELAPAVAQLAVDRGWSLYRLEPETRDLEQIFVSLTSGEEADAA